MTPRLLGISAPIASAAALLEVKEEIGETRSKNYDEQTTESEQNYPKHRHRSPLCGPRLRSSTRRENC